MYINTHIKADKSFSTWNTGSGATDNNVHHLKDGNFGVGIY
jgi:hypothetical protein